jgi:hypothetical protein
MATASASRADKDSGRRAAPLVSAAPPRRPCSASASRPAEVSGQRNGEGDTKLFSQPANPEREPE